MWPYSNLLKCTDWLSNMNMQAEMKCTNLAFNRSDQNSVRTKLHTTYGAFTHTGPDLSEVNHKNKVVRTI